MHNQDHPASAVVASKTTPKPLKIPMWARVGYVLMVVLCFLLFQQIDLYHTSASSYAYLHGHISDFYDYNQPRMERNDYMPVLYAIFAAWNLPLKMLGLMSTINPTSPPGMEYQILTATEVIWAKLLLIVALACAVALTAKISRLIAMHSHAGTTGLGAPVLLATSPIALFAVVIFGQYDILGVCFVLAGFIYFMEEKPWQAATFFSIAVSFKFFALVIFVPLVLLFEKNIIRIFLLWFIGGMATLAQIAVYWSNQAFREGIFFQIRGKSSPITESASIFLTPMFYLLALYAVLCVGVYFYRPTSWIAKARAAVFLPIAAYGLMFSSVIWHPQWLVIATPFFALAVLFLRNKKMLMLGDALGGVALIWISVNFWRFNVDSSMLTLGPLKAWFPFVYTGLFSFLSDRFTPVWRLVFNVYLFLPILLLILERVKPRWQWASQPAINTMVVRALVVVGVFVFPSLLTAWMPRSVAVRLDPNALVAGLLAGHDFASSTKPAGEIYGAHDVRQQFIAPRGGLQAIGVRLATYARSNTSTFRMRLLNDAGNIIVEKRWPAAKIGDSVFQYLALPRQADSAGQRYTLVLDSEDGAPGNALTVWMGVPREANAGQKLQLGNADVLENLAMRLYFSREDNGF